MQFEMGWSSLMRNQSSGPFVQNGEPSPSSVIPHSFSFHSTFTSRAKLAAAALDNSIDFHCCACSQQGRALHVGNGGRGLLQRLQLHNHPRCQCCHQLHGRQPLSRRRCWLRDAAQLHCATWSDAASGANLTMAAGFSSASSCRLLLCSSPFVHVLTRARTCAAAACHPVLLPRATPSRHPSDWRPCATLARLRSQLAA